MAGYICPLMIITDGANLRILVSALFLLGSFRNGYACLLGSTYRDICHYPKTAPVGLGTRSEHRYMMAEGMGPSLMLRVGCDLRVGSDLGVVCDVGVRPEVSLSSSVNVTFGVASC